MKKIFWVCALLIIFFVFNPAYSKAVSNISDSLTIIFTGNMEGDIFPIKL
ncbi:MAG: hypothetical protein HQK76_10810 [Desulfobacterales bacterium]|nr:hypothetical protein [Desulfobacterales bacterium]